MSPWWLAFCLVIGLGNTGICAWAYFRHENLRLTRRKELSTDGARAAYLAWSTLVSTLVAGFSIASW